MLISQTLCDPFGNSCFQKLVGKVFDCDVTCEGLYADVEKVSDDVDMEDGLAFKTMIKQYEDYKRAYVENLEFNPDKTMSKFGKNN